MTMKYKYNQPTDMKYNGMVNAWTDNRMVALKEVKQWGTLCYVVFAVILKIKYISK